MRPSGFRLHGRALFAIAALSGGAPAAAHSFGVVYNLPVPLWLYLYGAAAALISSFVVVAYFVSVPAAATATASRELSGQPWVRALRRAKPALRVAGVALLMLCIVSGLFGTRSAYGNFNMSFFWIVFLLGFAYLTALLGDFYAALNPWCAIADGIARCWPGYTRGRYAWPAQLAYWPALALYAALIWLELFGHIKPDSLAIMLLAYTVLNLVAVPLFGRESWFRYGEFFGVFFSLIARCAPLDYRPASGQRRGELHLRKPFSGLLDLRIEHLSLLLFVLFMLSSTAFDGLHETVAWTQLFWIDLYHRLTPWLGANPFQAYPLLRRWYLVWQTLALLLSPFLYLAVYWLFVATARALTRSTHSVRELALRFTGTLLPIALVYHVTHYYTLLLVQGPRVLSLASDPLGRNWNLFGTAGWFRAPYIPDIGRVWHVQVALIVAGHILSVYLAHVEALRTFADARRATLSQLPMLVLMVMFTVAGLWILSQPIQPGG
ncbi:hypothetical protein [Solimonas terrae]|uniref:Fenitrothion hydrolase n=1 Tax=Solimonas terrae TaxID=1396819 RepID=A0A6M2BV42_9GAMM|nr:hypothetical protein [Solimonas terrae]NGY06264.1 hypothetical protein [Solimonas terrae]